MEIKTSDGFNEVAKALLKFHKLIGKVMRDSKGQAGNRVYNYASLSSIHDSIDPILSDCGLVVTQHPLGENELQTMLIHADSGQYMSSTYTMRPTQNTPQGIGSCITYMSRYAICSILGLNLEDDDGSAAGKTVQKQSLLRQHVNNELFDWILKNEQRARDEKKPFSMKGLIEKHYIADEEVMQLIINGYINYKTNNNV